MQLKDFYLTVTKSEENTTVFLYKENILLNIAEETLPYLKYGSEMDNAKKRNQVGEFCPVLRWEKKL